MTAGRKRLLNAAIVVGVAAIAVAAVVNVVRSDGSAAAPVEPAADAETQPVDTGGTLPGELPEILTLPSDLRAEGGVLWWFGTGCGARAVDLSSGLVTRGPPGTCDLWPSADGGRAIASVAPDEEGGYGIVPVTYPPSEGETVFAGEEKIDGALALFTPTAWHPDGKHVAVCEPRDGQIFLDVLDLENGTRGAEVNVGTGGITGFCQASFLSDGRLAVVRDGTTVEVDGRDIFGEEDAVRLLPDVSSGTRSITALGAGGGLLVVGLRSDVPPAAAIAALRPDGTIVFSAALRPDVFPAAAGVAPDGQSLWYLNGTSGAAAILEIPGGSRYELYRARWLAWSPDGNYMAAVVREGIEIISLRNGGRLLTTLDVPADIVTWTERPREG